MLHYIARLDRAWRRFLVGYAIDTCYPISHFTFLLYRAFPQSIFNVVTYTSSADFCAMYDALPLGLM